MRSSRAIRTAWVVLVLALSCSAGAALASGGPSRPTLGGTWLGKYSGAFSGKFTLHWKLSGTRLTGSIVLSNPGGTYGITGSVHRNAISFGAVGVGATYTGSVVGTTMAGRYKSPQGGGSWSAHKLSLRTR